MSHKRTVPYPYNAPAPTTKPRHRDAHGQFKAAPASKPASKAPRPDPSDGGALPFQAKP